MVHSIQHSPNISQEGTGPKSTDIFLIDKKNGQDHETEEETRRRLDEWRSLAANLTDGFTQMPNQVRTDSTLSTNAKIIYEHLLGYMWSKEWCWPSQQRIADELGISRRTVIRACKELHTRGYIEKWRRGLGRTNVYFVNPLAFVTSFKKPGRGHGVLLSANSPEHQAHVSRTSAPDVLASLFTQQQCQNDTSRSDRMSQPEAPESHTKHTKQEKNKMIDIASNNSTEPKKGTGVGGKTIRSEIEQQANEEGTNTQQPNSTNIAKPNQQPSGQEQAAAGHAKTVNTAKQAKPSVQAQAIAASTGIPAEHLAEMGIAQEPRRRPIPDFITRKMIDLTRDLGDAPRSAKSNATRAAKLFYFGVDYCVDAQEDPEGWFTALLGQIKGVALQATNVKHRTGSRINRMPIFFFELEKLFKFNDDEWAYIRSDLAIQVPR